jgi:hypothetical protein
MAVGCGGDDDEENGGGAGTTGTGGGAGSGGAGTCKGVYADKTQAELAAEAGDGACTSAADIAAVCANDINTVAASCGLSCFAQGGDEAAQLQCNTECVTAATDPDPSVPCMGCYLQSVACVRENCVTQCVSDPTAPACIQCRLDEGCTGAFYNDCSGLPLPTGVELPQGGQGGGGG